MEYETTKVAEILHGYVINGMFASALALKVIFDNQLFRHLGCNTQKDYIDKYLPFERMQAYRYIKVADVFVECLKIDLNKSATFGKFLSSGRIEDVSPVIHSESEILSQVWSLGVKKLFLLATKMPIETMKILADKGAISFGEGAGMFFVADLKTMSYDMLVTLVNGSVNGSIIISESTEKETVKEIDLDKESKVILTQARYVRVKLSQLCEYANPSIAAHMGVSVPPELTEKASRLVDLTNRLLKIEEQLENLLTGDKNAN